MLCMGYASAAANEGLMLNYQTPHGGWSTCMQLATAMRPTGKGVGKHLIDESNAPSREPEGEEERKDGPASRINVLAGLGTPVRARAHGLLENGCQELIVKNKKGCAHLLCQGCCYSLYGCSRLTRKFGMSDLRKCSCQYFLNHDGWMILSGAFWLHDLSMQ